VLSDLSSNTLSFENYIEAIDFSEFYKPNLNSIVLNNIFADVYADTLDFSSIDITNGSYRLPSIEGARVNTLKYFKVDDEFLDIEKYNNGSFSQDNGNFAMDALLGQVGYLTSPDFMSYYHADALMHLSDEYKFGLSIEGYYYSQTDSDNIFYSFSAGDRTSIDRVFAKNASSDPTANLIFSNSFYNFGSEDGKVKLSSSVQCSYEDLQVGDCIIYYADGSEIDMAIDSDYTPVQWKELIGGSTAILSLSDLSAERTIVAGSIVRRLDSNWTWGFEDSRQQFSAAFTTNQYGDSTGRQIPYQEATVWLPSGYIRTKRLYLSQEWLSIANDTEAADWLSYQTQCFSAWQSN